MDETLDAMIAYLDRHALDPLSKSLESQFGAVEVRVAYFAVLEWLYERYQCGIADAPEVSPSFSWHPVLLRMLEDSDLGEFLVLNGQKLEFSSTVTPGRVAEIQRHVGEHFEPPLFEDE